MLFLGLDETDVLAEVASDHDGKLAVFITLTSWRPLYLDKPGVLIPLHQLAVPSHGCRG